MAHKLLLNSSSPLESGQESHEGNHTGWSSNCCTLALLLRVVDGGGGDLLGLVDGAAVARTLGELVNVGDVCESHILQDSMYHPAR